MAAEKVRIDPDDAELISRFQRGDARAFATLARRWSRRAYALAYRLTQDANESEDIRQTALLRAHQRLCDFNGRASFSTWLYRVVLNLCHDRLRSRRAADEALRRAKDIRPGVRRVQPSPLADSEISETARRVADAVKALPSPLREVVVMRHYQDLRFAEIAEIVEAPVTTVKSRMNQGLRLLRKSLKDVEHD